jgi:hypothetical protein
MDKRYDVNNCNKVEDVEEYLERVNQWEEEQLKRIGLNDYIQLKRKRREEV